VATRTCRSPRATLTGESTSVAKTAEAQLAPETLLADRANMAYASTLVTYVRAEAWWSPRVITPRWADFRMISDAPSLETPLTRKMAAFSHKLLILILGLAALVLAVGLARGERLEEIVSSAIALAVGAIPEGLPAAVTVTLAIGVAPYGEASGHYPETARSGNARQHDGDLFR